MEKIAQLKSQFLNPKHWVYISTIISLITGFAWIVYQLNTDYVASERLENRIDKLQQQQAKTQLEIKDWQGQKLLPLLNKQLEYARDYFKLYDLNFSIEDKSANGIYQNVVVNGKLANLLLAIHDLDTVRLLVEYKNIAVDDSVAALHLVILGRNE